MYIDIESVYLYTHVIVYEAVSLCDLYVYYILKNVHEIYINRHRNLVQLYYFNILIPRIQLHVYG